MKFKLFVTLLLSLFLNNVAIAAIDEGIEYKLVSPAQPTITKNKIEVVELFWYGCPHCFNFEPDMKEWLAKKTGECCFLSYSSYF